MPKPLRLPNTSEQAVLEGLSLRLLDHADDKERWDKLVIERHYLKSARLVGEQLRYVAQYQDRWLALLGWSAPALHLKAREAWIEWSPEQLRLRRHFLAQNSRFVLLVDRHQFPNLSTRALGLCCQRLSADWLGLHGHPIVAVESFVDSQLMFRGTAYKAAGWMLLGPTAGFGRCAEDFYQRHGRPKQLWVRALDPEGLAGLKAQTLPPRLAPYEAPAQPRALSGKPFLSLLDRLPAVPEPRGTRGRRHGWPAVLGIVCLAKLAGVAGAQRDIARFAKRLDQRQRRHLGCWRNPKTGRREVPSQSTFFRALKTVSYDVLEPLLVGWQDDLLGPADLNELVVLDGKVARAAGGQTVVSAIAVPSGRVLGVEVVRNKEELQPEDRPQVNSEPTQRLTPSSVPTASASVAAPGSVSGAPAAPSAPRAKPQTPEPAQVPSTSAPGPAAKKENEIPAARRLLARIPITGRLVSLDALHTQHQTAGQVVLEAGADYLLTLKDNQSTLLETAQTLVPSVFFPSRPGGTQETDGPHGGEKPGPLRSARTGHSFDPADRTGAGRGRAGSPPGQATDAQGQNQTHRDVAGQQPRCSSLASPGLAQRPPQRVGH